MLIKSIKLGNIRSYLNEKIEFPSGSLLLSGDIGSGKSTILLAIEFALFGSKPSELPASSLLRHGKKEGFVELNLEIENKDIIIKRNLKRWRFGIKQEAGYIITNGIKKELSPVEMKAEIFGLLGYPKDLVSKSKDLIYRYTVYTPQEEMKRILFEDKDARLNTLRKVFNIDKYKRIKENTFIFIRAIKEKKKVLEGFTSDLEEKKKEKEKISKEISVLDENIKVIVPKVNEAKEETRKKKENVSVFESKINEFNKLKNNLEILETNLKNLVNERSRNKETLENLNKKIYALEKEIGKEEVKDENLREKISKISKEIKSINEDMDRIKQKINEADINKTKAEEIINKVAKIDKCPLCLQNVEHGHKDSIKERENKNIEESEKNKKVNSEKVGELKKKLDILEKEKEELKEKENKKELLKFKIKNLKEKKEEMSKIDNRQDKIKKEIGSINVNKIELNKEIDSLKNINEEYKKARSEFDKNLVEERKLDLEKVKLEKENESLNRIIKILEEEIAKKEKAKGTLARYAEMQNWMDNFFIKLMGTMEKHVMLQVHREFNELFKEWFNILIEDETISVRLDDGFTPIIEQNGYENLIENLSGGEKTAVALSYRLSLNKVINDVVSGIKTKDILMLDEPTDGFSSEQLDKVRDILDQLQMKQVIIVSHETKIESFVDKVIRVGKEEHVSLVM